MPQQFLIGAGCGSGKTATNYFLRFTSSKNSITPGFAPTPHNTPVSTNTSLDFGSLAQARNTTSNPQTCKCQNVSERAVEVSDNSDTSDASPTSDSNLPSFSNDVTLTLQARVALGETAVQCVTANR